MRKQWHGDSNLFSVYSIDFFPLGQSQAVALMPKGQELFTAIRKDAVI